MLYEIIERSVYINPQERRLQVTQLKLDTNYSKACRLKEGLYLIQYGSRPDGEI